MNGTDADAGVTDRSFRDALRSLIEGAHDSDVDIRRNWTCRTSEGVPDWEVEFVPLAEQSDRATTTGAPPVSWPAPNDRD